MDKFYITTAIDYTNDTIHIGHAFQKVIADVLARYYRIRIGKENVFFLTGTDEYGQNIAKTAEENGVSPNEWVNKIAAEDKKQHQALNISSNRFIRTTDGDHTKVAQEIWRRIEANGDIYLGEFNGLYCTSCEAYYTEHDLINRRCPFHTTLEIKKITEENYFFKWSKYQQFLIDHIKHNPDFIKPESRRREMLEFAKRGLQDIPVSRTSFSWGVPVPDHPGHILYVWVDALTNYLTGVGFLENPKQFEKFWPADLHLLGKDNVRWHTLLWPSILKSSGIELPKTVYGHAFLTLNGQKISKTLGNIVRPTDWTSKYGTDAVRYYLLRYTSPEEDSDISEVKLLAAYNGDLANGLGNLVARVAKLCEQNNIVAPGYEAGFDPKMEALLKEYKLNEALAHIWSEIAAADKKINKAEPWELSSNKVKAVLEDLIKRLQHIAYNLQPFLPKTAEKIFKQFTGSVKSAPPLFPRI